MTFLSYNSVTNYYIHYICRTTIRQRMKLRKLKIHCKFRRRENDMTTIPEIRLEGKWLENLGFKIGSKILVKQQRNKLTITIEKKQVEL